MAQAERRWDVTYFTALAYSFRALVWACDKDLSPISIRCSKKFLPLNSGSPDLPLADSSINGTACVSLQAKSFLRRASAPRGTRARRIEPEPSQRRRADYRR